MKIRSGGCTRRSDGRTSEWLCSGLTWGEVGEVGERGEVGQGGYYCKGSKFRSLMRLEREPERRSKKSCEDAPWWRRRDVVASPHEPD